MRPILVWCRCLRFVHGAILSNLVVAMMAFQPTARVALVVGPVGFATLTFGYWVMQRRSSAGANSGRAGRWTSLTGPALNTQPPANPGHQSWSRPGSQPRFEKVGMNR
jgi:hypothetical protein